MWGSIVKSIRYFFATVIAFGFAMNAHPNCYSQKSNLQNLDFDIGVFMFKYPTETAAALTMVAGADTFLTKKYDKDTRNVIYAAAIFAAAYCVWNDEQMKSCAFVASELTSAFNYRASLISQYSRSGCGLYE
ncbi:MAG: hypothetical protein AAGH90_10370 [Pseudomonadota bacterium]